MSTVNKKVIRTAGFVATVFLIATIFAYRSLASYLSMHHTNPQPGELFKDYKEGVFQVSYPTTLDENGDRSGDPPPPKSPVFPVLPDLFMASGFTKFHLTAYSDPLEVLRERKKYNAQSKQEKQDNQEREDNENNKKEEISSKDLCPKIKSEAELEASTQIFLNVPYSTMEAAVRRVPILSRLLDKAYEFHDSKIPKPLQWFHFGGSSVWLNDYEVHFMVLSISNSPSGVADRGYVRFLYAQLYDRNWKELPAGITLSVPYELETTVTAVEADGAKREKVINSELSYRDMEFPQVLPIAFDREVGSKDNWFYGPENPKIVVRRNPMGFEEPLVVFSMKSLAMLGRYMHLFQPFLSQLKRLYNRDVPFLEGETENWVPISKQKDRKHLKLVAILDPMRILTCNIETGRCDVIQNPKRFRYKSQLLPGAPFVELPKAPGMSQLIPQNRNVYLGFAKTELTDCGCGGIMTRPNLIVLVEDTNLETKKTYFKISHVSEYLDVKITLKPWRMPKVNEKGELAPASEEPCIGNIQHVVNSIAYWEVESVGKDSVLYMFESFGSMMEQEENDRRELQKAGTEPVRAEAYEYFDRLGLTMSSSDLDISVIEIKGMIKYLQGIPGIFDDKYVVSGERDFEVKGYNANTDCAIFASKDYCKALGDELKGKYKAKQDAKAEEDKRKEDEKKAEKENKAEGTKNAEEKEATEENKVEEGTKNAEEKDATEENKVEEGTKNAEVVDATEENKVEEWTKNAEEKKATEENKVEEGTKNAEEKEATEENKVEEGTKNAEKKEATEENKVEEGTKNAEEKEATKENKVEEGTKNAEVVDATEENVGEVNHEPKVGGGIMAKANPDQNSPKFKR